MNSGIADAGAAASAIAAALGARSEAEAKAAIGRFDSERGAAAEWNRAAAGQALDHLRAHTLWRRTKRQGAALAAPWWLPAGEWLDTAPYGPSGGPPAVGTKY
jgi:3-(3-hydroxy-phenyl)propionate hydroxylase